MSADQPLTRIGRHEIVRLLGRGGMGSVYLARDPVIGRSVAIKLISQGLDDPRARERLTREAKAAGHLHHPHIVTIFDVGEHDGQLFIAMEYVRGESLAAALRKRTPMTMGQRMSLVEQACAALAYAHRAGTVHLDIKPDNLMIDEEGRLKILDFGIATVSGDESTRTSGSGTLRYMSPEQLTGGSLDHRSDVFALGCVLYEIVSSVPAFDGSVKDVVARVLAGDPVPLESAAPGVDRELSSLVARMLAREPERRPDDLAQVGRQLAAIRLRLTEDKPAVARAAPDADRSPRARRWAWAAGVLVLGLAVASVLWRASSDPARRAAESEARPPSAEPKPAPTVTDPLPSPPPAVPGAVAPDTPNSRNKRQMAGGAGPAAPPPAPLVSPPREATRTGVPSIGQPLPVEPRLPVPPDPAPTPPVAPPTPEKATPPPANVPSPPPVSPPTVLSEEAAIAATLRRYETAYESLDVNLVRDVYPTLTQEQVERLTRDFAALNSYRLDFSGVTVSITGDTAVVTCTIIRQIAPRVGRAAGTTTPTTIRLRKQGGTWTIERLSGR